MMALPLLLVMCEIYCYKKCLTFETGRSIYTPSMKRMLFDIVNRDAGGHPGAKRSAGQTSCVSRASGASASSARATREPGPRGRSARSLPWPWVPALRSRANARARCGRGTRAARAGTVRTHSVGHPKLCRHNGFMALSRCPRGVGAWALGHRAGLREPARASAPSAPAMHQYRAFLGVRGNGIAAPTLARPVGRAVNFRIRQRMLPSRPSPQIASAQGRNDPLEATSEAFHACLPRRAGIAGCNSSPGAHTFWLAPRRDPDRWTSARYLGDMVGLLDRLWKATSEALFDGGLPPRTPRTPASVPRRARWSCGS